MRIIVFFDLPVETHHERKEYRKFRRFIINEGFIMMQKSVYMKLVLNNSVANSQLQRLKKNGPKIGIVEILKITEKQFSGIEYLVGERKSDVIDNEARLIIL